MSTEIKNTLFRFVTMRSPELSEEKNKDKRFVYRSANGVTFDNAVANRPSNKTKWQSMVDASPSFGAISEENLKSINAELYVLAVWMAKNKYSYTEADLKKEVLKVTTGLTPSQLTLLWDNLFYQVVTQKSFYAKEIIMQLLVANHLFRSYDESNKPLSKQLMNAKVVLPKQLFVENTSSAPIVARMAARGESEEEAQMSLPNDEMRQFQAISLSNINIERQNKLKKELQKVEKAYKKEYQVSFEKEQLKYQAEIQPIIDDYHKNVEDAKTKWCSVRNPDVPFDAADPCNEPPVVPMPKLPAFNFKFRNEIDLEHLKSVLSAPAFDTLLEVLEIETEDEPEKKGEGLAARIIPGLSSDTSLTSFQNVFTLIEDQVSNNTQTIISHTPHQGNTSISVGGVVIPTTNNAAAGTLPFSYQACPKIYSSNANGGTYVNFDVSFTVADSSWQISGVETTVEKYSGEKVVRTAFTQNRNGNSIMLTNLHNDALTTGDFYYVMKNLTVAITFTNGAKKSFTTDFWHTLNCATGRMLTILEPQPESTPSVPSVPATGADGSFIPSGFGVKQLGIADYKKVEQTVQGYVEGEVAAIENVMAREYKEKATRKLRRSENTTTSTSEREKEQLSDTTNTSRFEMQSEVAKVLQESKDLSAGGNFGMEWGGATTGGTKFTLGANVNMATHTSREESTRQAVNQAKEVTERAMERIVTKVKEERIEKIIEEFEDNNKHGFDNTKGDKHVVGVYRWVDKVYKNQIYNYGKRLMFEFMVPEPAKLHILGMSENGGSKLIEPVDPRKFVDTQGTTTPLNLKDFTCVNDATVKYWGGKLNVDLDASPSQFLSVGKEFNFSGLMSGGNSWSDKANLTLPEGYKTVDAVVTVSSAAMQTSWGKSIGVSVGNLRYYCGSLNDNWRLYPKDGEALNAFEGNIPVSVFFITHHVGIANVSVKLERTANKYQQWQQETFKAIIDAYEDAVVEYEQKLAEEQAKGVVIKGTNPGFYREIENMVLRKNCISYIIDQNTTARRTYGKDMTKPLASGVDRSFGNHEIKVDANLDDYAAFAKFIEQAFEWDIMSYNFYPYYWGAREDWAKLYQYDNNDPLFRSFMQAGMARVIVTVRPGFEEVVSYYLQTGQIWNGGEVPVIEDELFLSIVDELREPEGQKEGKAWATRLPTALTILQADSIGLKVDKALPYDEDLSDFEDPASVPHSPNFHITGAQMNGASSKTVTFSYEDMDSFGNNTIGHYDSYSSFPRTFRCMGEEIVIERDAAWQSTDSAKVIYTKLAEQLSLIPGIDAQQYTSADNNEASIRFIVDTSVVPTFVFEKETPVTVTMPELDQVKVLFNSDSVKFTNPTAYYDRILDANGTKLASAEVNTLLPISRFSI